MFVIFSYDINQKRVGKVLKICRKYLVHVHKSVFEGIITEGKLNSLKKELQRIIDYDEDAICIYSMNSTQYMLKEQIGVVDDHGHII